MRYQKSRNKKAKLNINVLRVCVETFRWVSVLLSCHLGTGREWIIGLFCRFFELSKSDVDKILCGVLKYSSVNKRMG